MWFANIAVDGSPIRTLVDSWEEGERHALAFSGTLVSLTKARVSPSTAARLRRLNSAA